VLCLYVAMLKENVESKQFRWLPPMCTTMLTYLPKRLWKEISPPILLRQAPLLCS